MKRQVAKSGMNRVYLSGPMTGIPEYNRRAFMAAEARLRTRGFVTVNPWRMRAVEGWNRPDYMRRDIASLAGCDAIYMLPGWTRSIGARWEWLIARWCFRLERIR